MWRVRPGDAGDDGAVRVYGFGFACDVLTPGAQDLADRLGFWLLGARAAVGADDEASAKGEEVA